MMKNQPELVNIKSNFHDDNHGSHTCPATGKKYEET